MTYGAVVIFGLGGLGGGGFGFFAVTAFVMGAVDAFPDCVFAF